MVVVVAVVVVVVLLFLNMFLFYTLFGETLGREESLCVCSKYLFQNDCGISQFPLTLMTFIQEI